MHHRSDGCFWRPFSIISRQRRSRRNHRRSRKSHRNRNMWKPVEFPEFKYGRYQRLLREWGLESPEELREWGLLPPEEPVEKPSQPPGWPPVWESVEEGYDVDVRCSTFFPVPISDYIKCEMLSKRLSGQVIFVIAEINSQAEMHSERYEFDKLVKVVEARPIRTTFITFCVKEVARNPNVVRTVRAEVFNPAYYNFKLIEWSFKPQEEE